jgi:hypothetical protein
MNKLVGTKVKKKEVSTNINIVYLNRFAFDFKGILFQDVYRNAIIRIFAICLWENTVSPAKIDNFVKSEKLRAAFFDLIHLYT